MRGLLSRRVCVVPAKGAVHGKARLLFVGLLVFLAAILCVTPAVAATNPAVSAGKFLTLGVRSDGTVVRKGLIGSSSADVSNFTDVIRGRGRLGPHRWTQV